MSQGKSEVAKETMRARGSSGRSLVVAPARMLRWVRRWPVILVLLAIGLYTLLPLLFTLSTSFKGIKELWTSDAFFPRQPSLGNYRYMLLHLKDLPIYFVNSAIVSLGAVALNLFCATLMGYAFSRMEFRGRDLLFYGMIIAMFIPQGGTLMAEYELMASLGLRNSRVGLVLYFASGLSVPTFIMRQAFLSLPRELEESAMIDGANRWRLLWSIALPFGAGAMTVVGIIVFVGTWGDYLFTFTMVDAQNLYTVGVGVAMMVQGGSDQIMDPMISSAGIQSAAYLAAAAPAMLLYVTLQKYFIRGLSEGILKL